MFIFGREGERREREGESDRSTEEDGGVRRRGRRTDSAA